MGPKDANRMVNSEDPNENATSEAVWSGYALFAHLSVKKIRIIMAIYTHVMVITVLR